MSDVSRPRRSKKSDKFEDLKIETQQLKDDAEPEAEKVAPSSTTSKKRRRRPAAEIDRWDILAATAQCASKCDDPTSHAFSGVRYGPNAAAQQPKHQ
ncbi:hypothetical protein PInf_022088 [Phytophthora infestans]|nr:hypothetical protein PInf_022088 [Phytophthora infestans]